LPCDNWRCDASKIRYLLAALCVFIRDLLANRLSEMCCNMFNVIVNDLHKHYRIYSRPIDRLAEAVIRKPRHKLYKVLSGVSFSLAPRRSLGIIGDNGAGKSTLLKLLAGTVSPTSGTVEIRGRFAALLELGAGFHPEFTGRQNIFLNASLLGLSKKETQEREQAIIDFSELEEFIDRPVKHYSSGMYVRLAFSIATSIDPDILIIDEALSVGDMAFQRKCVDRMNAFKSQGKTMLFCSHSMYHVQELCENAIWIDHGQIRYMGSSVETVARYEDYCKAKKAPVSEVQSEPVRVSDGKDCHISLLCIEDGDGNPTDTLMPYKDAVLRMDVEILKDGLLPRFGFGFLMPDETPLYGSMTHHDGILCGPYSAGKKITVRLHLKKFPVREGTYRMVGGIAENSGLLWYEYKIVGPVKIQTNKGLGLLSCGHEWEIIMSENGA
jgi:lipopolysaccharide transport system ATP-binding protein